MIYFQKLIQVILSDCDPNFVFNVDLDCEYRMNHELTWLSRHAIIDSKKVYALFVISMETNIPAWINY